MIESGGEKNKIMISQILMNVYLLISLKFITEKKTRKKNPNVNEVGNQINSPQNS